MAVNHDGGVLGYEFQALRNLPHGYERGPFDPGDLIFPGLAAVDEKRLLILAVHHLGQRLRFNLHPNPTIQCRTPLLPGPLLKSRPGPLTRLSRDSGIATLSPQGAGGLWSGGFQARQSSSVHAQDSTYLSIPEAASRERLASLPRRLRSTVAVQDRFSPIRAVGFQAPRAAQAGQPCAPAS